VLKRDLTGGVAKKALETQPQPSGAKGVDMVGVPLYGKASEGACPITPNLDIHVNIDINTGNLAKTCLMATTSNSLTKLNK
jgi:hypothetical protein